MQQGKKSARKTDIFLRVKKQANREHERIHQLIHNKGDETSSSFRSSIDSIRTKMNHSPDQVDLTDESDKEAVEHEQEPEDKSFDNLFGSDDASEEEEEEESGHTDSSKCSSPPSVTSPRKRDRSSLGQSMPPPPARAQKPAKRARGESSTRAWGTLPPGSKAAALKTYTDAYGKHSLSRQLRCVRKSVQTTVSSLETDLIAAYNNALFLKLGFEEDAALKSADKRYRSAFASLLKNLDKLNDKTMFNLLQFVRHDVHLIHSIEDEINGFVREVANQCDDVVHAYPPPQPERMINLSLFDRHPSTRGSGGKKRSGSGTSSHITGSASSTRRTAAGGLSSSAALSSGSSGQGRAAAGNRGKKSTGLRPVMNEFTDYLSRLSS